MRRQPFSFKLKGEIFRLFSMNLLLSEQFLQLFDAQLSFLDCGHQFSNEQCFEFRIYNIFSEITVRMRLQKYKIDEELAEICVAETKSGVLDLDLSVDDVVGDMLRTENLMENIVVFHCCQNHFKHL